MTDVIEGERTDGYADADEDADESARRHSMRARNRRTGLILATIALVFFVGIIVKYTLLRH